MTPPSLVGALGLHGLCSYFRPTEPHLLQAIPQTFDTEGCQGPSRGSLAQGWGGVRRAGLSGGLAPGNLLVDAARPLGQGPCGLQLGVNGLAVDSTARTHVIAIPSANIGHLCLPGVEQSSQVMSCLRMPGLGPGTPQDSIMSAHVMWASW